MKAIILARVSTREQEERGHSLDAQKESLRKYADRKEFDVVKEFAFSETAGPKIRSKFEEVLDYIRKHKDVRILLCENVDRATRNFRDAVDLDDLRINDGLEIHFVKDGFFINAEATGNQMFMWETKVFLAKQYLNRLSDDVKRSLRQKLANGQWIGQAPLGYLNTEDERGNKTIVPNPEKAHLIIKLFELYATGNYSIKTVRDAISKLGLRGKNSGKITPSTVHHILKESFYYGVMTSRGREYPHAYEPLTSRYLFLKAQEQLASYKKKPFQYRARAFALRSLVRCANCGCTVTPEIKKGKYIYYSCTNYKGFCKRVWVPEKDLLKPVYEALRDIQMPEERIQGLTEGLKAMGQSEARFYRQNVDSLKAEHDKIEDRISKMYDDKLDGRITQDMYDTKLKEYKEKQHDILDQMREHTEADEEFYITANTVFNLGKRALEIFESSEPIEKRQLLGYLLQNCRLQGKNLVFDLRSPFDKVISTASQPIGLPLLDTFRTLNWVQIRAEIVECPELILTQSRELLAAA